MVIKVLIVEDSSIVRKVLNDVLGNVDGVVLSGECLNASTAVAAIRANSPDIVLLDIQLSQGTGMDVLTIAISEKPSIKVIVVSNFADDVYRTHYLKAGAIAFFDKSMELSSLQKYLQQLSAEPNPSLPSKDSSTKTF